MTELANTHNVSRQFLYKLRERAIEAWSVSLAPRQFRPQPQERVLKIDQHFIQRAIAVLPLLKGSVRDIQYGLYLLFGGQYGTIWGDDVSNARIEQSRQQDR